MPQNLTARTAPAPPPQYVIFYDLGSGSAEAALVKYSSYSAKDGGKAKAISQLEVRGAERAPRVRVARRRGWGARARWWAGRGALHVSRRMPLQREGGAAVAPLAALAQICRHVKPSKGKGWVGWAVQHSVKARARPAKAHRARTLAEAHLRAGGVMGTV